MVANRARRRCAHPGCAAWAAPGGELCRLHGGRLAIARCHPPARSGPLPALDDEIARLAALRDRVERWLDQMMADGAFDPAEVRRSLTALSQVGRTLSMMLGQHGAAEGGANELQRLLAAAAQMAREQAREKTA